jgi:hypothetical protein
MTTIVLQFWAGARAVAGTNREEWSAGSVAAALELARSSRSDPGFDRVLAMCSILVDGRIAGPTELVRSRTEPVVAEVLPPYAGG